MRGSPPPSARNLPPHTSPIPTTDADQATGEGLAGLRRPGRAGSDNAADHLAVLDAALAQLPVTPDDIEIGAHRHRRGDP